MQGEEREHAGDALTVQDCLRYGHMMLADEEASVEDYKEYLPGLLFMADHMHEQFSR